MAKFAINKDEWCPVYELSTERAMFCAGFIEITDDEWVDYQRVLAEFDAWQKRLRAEINNKAKGTVLRKNEYGLWENVKP